MGRKESNQTNRKMIKDSNEVKFSEMVLQFVHFILHLETWFSEYLFDLNIT